MKYQQDQMIVIALIYSIKETYMTFLKELFLVLGTVDNVENLPWKMNNIQYYSV